MLPKLIELLSLSKLVLLLLELELVGLLLQLVQLLLPLHSLYRLARDFVESLLQLILLLLALELVDLSDRHVKLARDRGLKIVISTDAHDPQHFKLMRYGVTTALPP